VNTSPKYAQFAWPVPGDGPGLVFEVSSAEGHVWEHLFYEDDPTHAEAGLIVEHLLERYYPAGEVDVRRPTVADLENIELMRQLASDGEQV
jgi:hypothetical protein